MNKKVLIVLATLLPTLCFAEQCPRSQQEANAAHWVNQYPKLQANFQYFMGAVWHKGDMFCAYRNTKGSLDPAVLRKYNYVKPNYGSGTLWRLDPSGIICEHAINRCTFTKK